MVDRGLKNAPNSAGRKMRVRWKMPVPAGLSRQSPSQVRDGGEHVGPRGHGWEVSATEYVP